MLIVCPHCATSYDVAPTHLGESGRSVRCVRCRQVWFAENPKSEPQAADPADGRRAEEDLSPAMLTPALPESSPASAADEAPESRTTLTDVEQAVAEDERAMAEAADLPVDDRGPADIINAPPIVPPQQPETAENPEAAEPEAGFPHDGRDLEMLVARRAKRMMTRKRGRSALPAMPALIVVLLTIVATLLLWRKDVVRIAPQTASLYAKIGLPVNLRGLSFAKIKTGKDSQDGVDVLVLEGQIVSESRQPVEVPRLRFAIRNAAGYEIYSWTALANQTTIAPGQAVAFRSRLASPPADGHDVTVRFFSRRDTVAGLH
ncbi:MAG: zinc-ribbon domain-containing protein [Pseudorhodoplanes sp.]